MPLYLFKDRDNVEINLCKRRHQVNSAAIYTGNYDLLSFIWFQGPERLYGPASCKFRTMFQNIFREQIDKSQLLKKQFSYLGHTIEKKPSFYTESIEKIYSNLVVGQRMESETSTTQLQPQRREHEDKPQEYL